mmetsp:Transcript_6207/g.20244  ORF Transcript_6207/g.20244 Transcript_6207/m.20244 type:complete len:212 (-) Transcript_6207:602-1237(-)
MFFAMAFCIPVISTGPFGSSLRTTAAPSVVALGVFVVATTRPRAASTSARVTRPNCPVPVTVARSRPLVFASLIADGVAVVAPGVGVHFFCIDVVVPAAAPVTSRATTRPPGPLPLRVVTSTPASDASFFAYPDAGTRPPGAKAAPTAGAVVAALASATTTGAAPPTTEPRAPAAATWAMVSSVGARRATGAPTSASSPSFTKMAAMKPSS